MFIFLLFILFSAEASQAEAPRNVILITIDTLRGDSIAINGSKKVKTPYLDSLAHQGVNFARGRASVPLTLPSHASIMTGLYPVQHGIRDNGTNRLNEEHSTLAVLFKKQGYQTAAFVGSFVLDHRFGLNQGFDIYDDAMPIGMLESPEAQRNADAVYSAFFEWLNRSHNNSPFFVWIHFYDPHAPYNPPEPYRTQYKNDPYSGEIAYTDSVIGKMLNDLQTKGLLNKSIIAVAGDHGEGLGDHHEQTHSLLIYNSTLHVPMILFAPGFIKPGTSHSGLSRLIDLGPTLLDYAQIKGTLAGNGITLRSAIENKNDAPIYSFSESLYPKLNLGWSELHGIEAGKYRYIDAPKPELYDVINDPGELQNQVQKFPDIARKLNAEIDHLYKKQAGETPSNEELDPETKERLASLGYVSGSSSASKGPSGVDPKDRIQIWNNIQSGIYQFGNQNYKEAITTFESVLKTEKNTRIVYDNLCSAYIKLKQYGAAKSCIQKAISNGVDFAALHVNFGQIYHIEKQYDLAHQEFQIAAAMDPGNVLAHYSLGNTLRAKGEHEQAVLEFQKALQINPRYVYAINSLAMTYSALRRDEQALKAFALAAEYDPQNPSAYFNLAIQAEKMKKGDQALGAYRKFLELSTDTNFAQQRQRANEAIRRLSNNP